jgi:hypothetical protein
MATGMVLVIVSRNIAGDLEIRLGRMRHSSNHSDEKPTKRAAVAAASLEPAR